MSPEDHKRLAECLSRVKHAKFIVSYDNVSDVRVLYREWAYVQEIAARYSIRGQNRESWRDDRELVVHNMPHPIKSFFA